MVSDNRTRIPAIGIQKVVDLILVVLSFGLATAFIIRSQEAVSLGQFLATRIRISNFLIFGSALLVCHLVFCICGIYQSRRLSNKAAEMLDIAKATTLSVACFCAIGSIFSVQMLTPDLVLAFWGMSTAVLIVFRLLLRTALASIRAHGRNQHYMLIVGTNPRAMEFGRRISTSIERGYRILGFVDDNWAGLEKFNESGFPLVSNLAGLAEFLRRNVVDEIVVYLPFGSFYRYCADVEELCHQHGIILRFSSDIFNGKKCRWRAESDGIYFVADPGTGGGWPLIVKRTLDIVISMCLLVALLPLFSITALAIKLSSRGPIFFLQERIGLNKRRFRIYKFRTMVPDAEKLMQELMARNEATGPVFKIRNDPRVTPIGRLLRRTSIDELPQLINVLKGHMSLVGPRPLPVRDYEGFSEDWQRRRFSVKPGIACLWQVNGRSGIPFDQWMLLDLQYMDDWSLWLDFKILAKTVPAVFKGEGAA